MSTDQHLFFREDKKCTNPYENKYGHLKADVELYYVVSAQFHGFEGEGI
jgi:hypothetical protein